MAMVDVERPVFFRENEKAGQVVIGVKEWKLQTVLGYRFAVRDYENAEMIAQSCVDTKQRDEIYKMVRDYAEARKHTPLEADFLAIHFMERATRWDDQGKEKADV